jgi:O-antigen/teichoic acid export membrane protein
LLTILAIITAVMLIFQAISLSLVPLINAARDSGAVGEKRFRRLHRLSVLLTVLVLLLSLVVIAAVVRTASLGGAT